MKYISGLLFIAAMAFASCVSHDVNDDDPECLRGETIGKIRSSGGGLAVKLDKPIPGVVQWQGHNNVVELQNMPSGFMKAGSRFYFSSREALPGEQGPITADGDETIELVLFGVSFKESGCP